LLRRAAAAGRRAVEAAAPHALVVAVVVLRARLALVPPARRKRKARAQRNCVRANLTVCDNAMIARAPRVPLAAAARIAPAPVQRVRKVLRRVLALRHAACCRLRCAPPPCVRKPHAADAREASAAAA
jgi:hypothetical protein